MGLVIRKLISVRKGQGSFHESLDYYPLFKEMSGSVIDWLLRKAYKRSFEQQFRMDGIFEIL